MVIDCCFCHRYLTWSPSTVSISGHCSAAAVVADFSISTFKGIRCVHLNLMRSLQFIRFIDSHLHSWATCDGTECSVVTPPQSHANTWMNQWPNGECDNEKCAILFESTAHRISNGVGVLVPCISDTSFARGLYIDDIRYMRLRSKHPTQTYIDARHLIFKPISWKRILTMKQRKFNTGQGIYCEWWPMRQGWLTMSCKWNTSPLTGSNRR